MTATTTAPKGKQKTDAKAPPEFEVEFGNDGNHRIMVSFFKRQVRGRFSIAGLFSREGGARNPGKMAAMPDHPGQRLRISPSKGEVLLWDPLEKDKQLLDRVNKVLSESFVAQRTVTFVPESRTTVKDPDRLKTLILEVVRLHANGDCRVTKGRLPTDEEIEAMPGDELYDPWSTNRYKPRYAKDGAEYERQTSMRPL